MSADGLSTVSVQTLPSLSVMANYTARRRLTQYIAMIPILRETPHNIPKWLFDVLSIFGLCEDKPREFRRYEDPTHPLPDGFNHEIATIRRFLVQHAKPSWFAWAAPLFQGIENRVGFERLSEASLKAYTANQIDMQTLNKLLHQIAESRRSLRSAQRKPPPVPPSAMPPPPAPHVTNNAPSDSMDMSIDSSHETDDMDISNSSIILEFAPGPSWYPPKPLHQSSPPPAEFRLANLPASPPRLPLSPEPSLARFLPHHNSVTQPYSKIANTPYSAYQDDYVASVSDLEGQHSEATVKEMDVFAKVNSWRTAETGDLKDEQRYQEQSGLQGEQCVSETSDPLDEQRTSSMSDLKDEQHAQEPSDLKDKGKQRAGEPGNVLGNQHPQHMIPDSSKAIPPATISTGLDEAQPLQNPMVNRHRARQVRAKWLGQVTKGLFSRAEGSKKGFSCQSCKRAHRRCSWDEELIKSRIVSHMDDTIRQLQDLALRGRNNKHITTLKTTSAAKIAVRPMSELTTLHAGPSSEGTQATVPHAGPSSEGSQAAVPGAGPSSEGVKVTVPCAGSSFEGTQAAIPHAGLSPEGITVTVPHAGPSSEDNQAAIPGAGPSSEVFKMTVPRAGPSSEGIKMTVPRAGPSSEGNQAAISGAGPSSEGIKVTVPHAGPLSEGNQATVPGAGPSSEGVKVTVPRAASSSEGVKVTVPRAGPSSEGNQAAISGAGPSSEGIKVTVPHAGPLSEGNQATVPGAGPSSEGVKVTVPRAASSSEGVKVTVPCAGPSSEGVKMPVPHTSPSSKDNQVAVPGAGPSSEGIKAAVPGAGPSTPTLSRVDEAISTMSMSEFSDGLLPASDEDKRIAIHRAQIAWLSEKEREDTEEEAKLEKHRVTFGEERTSRFQDSEAAAFAAMCFRNFEYSFTVFLGYGEVHSVMTGAHSFTATTLIIDDLHTAFIEIALDPANPRYYDCLTRVAHPDRGLMVPWSKGRA
ncbi:uncharacterized protein LAESUDRAFT_717036 [Laetiporus sulphureus 93-53]|uniref:Uncharacterized protein n=1 Tax=Laetiporus sulphureus 93-53 TaxID=1314785 RepID=A0A165C3A6_9APHY|nr:uncharacterized protein LAESUDRAFT_717036 [Laetiporus sulphureus 93-53]KZT02128.1 hypothetical protein LAESUDRAFT_717036 [Laetiporus sulphureus 93-53]